MSIQLWGLVIYQVLFVPSYNHRKIHFQEPALWNDAGAVYNSVSDEAWKS